MLKNQTEKNTCTAEVMQNEGQIRDKINTLENEVAELSGIISDLTNRVTPIIVPADVDPRPQSLTNSTEVSGIEKIIMEISDTVLDCQMRLITIIKSLRI